jgi:hypothetical protein
LTVAVENGRVAGRFAFHTLRMEVDGPEHWYWRPNVTADQFRKWQDPGWLAKRENREKRTRQGRRHGPSTKRKSGKVMPSHGDLGLKDPTAGI